MLNEYIATATRDNPVTQLHYAIDHGCNPRPSWRTDGREQFRARCPAHDDHTPSLYLSHGNNGGAVIHCFAGCDWRDILGTLGLDGRALFPSIAPTDFLSHHHSSSPSTVNRSSTSNLYTLQRSLGSRDGEGDGTAEGVIQRIARTMKIFGPIDSFACVLPEHVGHTATISLPSNQLLGGF
jgi:hypothetical protein